MLSNAYFVAKFRFDTAENEPAKNLQNFRKCIFEKCIFEKCIFEKCIFRKWAGALGRGGDRASRAVRCVDADLSRAALGRLATGGMLQLERGLVREAGWLVNRTILKN